MQGPPSAKRPLVTALAPGAALLGATAVLLGVGVLVLAAAPARAADLPVPLLAQARLQGLFAMSGVVTKAVGVPGEHRGELVTRMWGFLPTCPVGACPTVVLVRNRPAGKDKLFLHRGAPGFYSGDGAFVAPVRCGGRLYPNGELAKFTITVQITAAVVQGAVVQVTGLRASYRNRSRPGLTRCFTAPSYDSARYVGAPPAVGAIRSVASARSSTAS